MATITGNHVGFQYRRDQTILADIHFSIEPGKITAIIGKNGCGKSTLIKLITALLPITEGEISINGINITDKNGFNLLRQHCGIVFQNPDNQFVSPIIEDDITFGLKNHHVPENEQKERITEALSMVRLEGFEKRNIATLSGGQKQRVSAAGILAVNNDVLIFDEATSMLDPIGKEELLKCIENLRSQGKTIILITQNISDVLLADIVYLMADHHILTSGTVREVLTDYDSLSNAGVQIPFAVRMYHDLVQKGIPIAHCPLTNEELAEELCSLN